MKTCKTHGHGCRCGALSRRDFLTTAAIGAAAFALPVVRGQDAAASRKGSTGGASLPNSVKHRPVIDIHAHQAPDSMRGSADKGGGGGRTEAEFLAHQACLNAVGAVILGGNDYEYGFLQKDPNRYVRFANGGAGAGDRGVAIERALKNGARGIGELRYEGRVPFTTQVIELAREFDVPILFHFQQLLPDGTVRPDADIKDFYKFVEKYPTVKFIGHANDWWGAIDKTFTIKSGYLPKGRVTPGGVTDQWLGRYPNLYSDLSASSGNNALLRDPEFAKDFVERHQDKLMFGTDCGCKGDTATAFSCWGQIKQMALYQLRLSDAVQEKIFLSTAQKLLKLKIG